MTTEHPITPPPELVQQWLSEPRYAQPSKDGTFIVEKCHSLSASEVTNLVGKAARWGADQELEACCEWLRTYGHTYEIGLRAARRLKPPSLKEQALEELKKWREVIGVPQLDTICRALEQLDD